MTEIWLSSNRRVLLLAMAPAGLLGLLGILLLASSSWKVLTVVGWLAAVLSLCLLIGLAIQLSRPRIAYREGHVLFYLKAGGPIEVPIKAVEAFFLGQGPAHLPGEDSETRQSVNLVARISRRQKDWHQRDVKAALGSWCDGYVIFRGTWCEPLQEEVVLRINQRLSDAAKAYESARGSEV